MNIYIIITSVNTSDSFTYVINTFKSNISFKYKKYRRLYYKGRYIVLSLNS